MNCAVITGCLEDGPSLYSALMRRARKQHKCCECRELIVAGDQYEDVSGCWDGDFNTHKTCLLCVEIRAAFSDGQWVFGYIWQDLRDHFFPKMVAGGPCLEKLSAAAKEKMFAQWRKWKGIE